VATPTASVRLGWAIRSLRKRRKITIEALALDAGMHPTYLSGIERGERNPSWGKLCDLADTLGIPAATIADAAAEARCPACGRASEPGDGGG
jgi:transcriptional regulator with XRE-family HTH domain